MKRFLFVAVVILLSVLIGMRLDMQQNDKSVVPDSEDNSISSVLGEVVDTADVESTVDQPPEEFIPTVEETQEIVAEHEVDIECESNLDCFGKRELIKAMCMNGAAVKTYTRYICKNPGKVDARCVRTREEDVIIQDCGAKTDYCSQGECKKYTVVRPITVHEKYSWSAS